MNRPLADGEQLAHGTGRVLIVLQCVRLDHAYKVAVCHRSTGAEVDELTRSYPTETEARERARTYARTFADGRTVEQHVRATQRIAA